jgi:hypothetical protein
VTIADMKRAENSHKGSVRLGIITSGGMVCELARDNGRPSYWRDPGDERFFLRSTL